MQAEHVANTERASLESGAIVSLVAPRQAALVRGLTIWIVVPALLLIACSAGESSATGNDASGQGPSSTDGSSEGTSERGGSGGQGGEGAQPEAGGEPESGGEAERDAETGVDTDVRDSETGQPREDGRSDTLAPRDATAETTIRDDSSATDAAATVPDALVFSRTTGFRHASIVQGIEALRMLGLQRGWRVTATEDPAQFSDQGLSRFNVVVFLSTTGDVLNTDQQSAFERFIQRGNGYVGIHSASDTEYDWPWYGQLVGAYFQAHPAIQSAELHVEAAHPSTLGLPSTWTRTDEWYGFRDNPRSRVTVLVSIDESSYAPGAGAMGGDHPIAWYHEHDGGRAFYTALGHTETSFSEPLFLGHLAGAIEWAARR